MNRRTLLSMTMPALMSAQKLGRVPYRNYARCLPDYITALASEARERRDTAMAKLTTRDAIQARAKWARETFWKLTGGMPERTPLNVRTVGRFDRDGYRVEKLVYESRPGLVIPANLYIPTTGRPPYPGVLFQMGHSANGKAAVPYQKCCQGLVRLGYVVLGFDPMGQGERLYYPARLSPDDQHTMAGRQMLLAGDTATRTQAWDAVRSLDVLAARPEVDPKRLASTGQSGGGTLTQMLACVDDRLAAAAVSCGNTENFACEGFNAPGSTDDAEQNFIGSGLLGWDRWDMLYPLAPKPLLIVSSARDFFGTYSPSYIANGRAEFDRLRAVYRTLGAEERIEWGETPLAHSLSYALRVAIYNWFERWLKGSARTIDTEPPVAPERDEVLLCGSTGSVVRDFSSTTPSALTRTALARKQPGPGGGAKLDALLGVKPGGPAEVTILSKVPSERVDIQAIEVVSDPYVYLPAWVYRPRNGKTGAPAVLLLDQRGRNARAEEAGFHHQLALQGCTVYAADLRGLGDLTPEFSRGQERYARNHASEENWAWASLILGRPLLAQRVADILALSAWLAAQAPRVVVAASGKLTVPALMAASIDRRIAGLYLAGGLRSFQSVLDADEYTEPLANFLPGVLLHTDLPAIAESIAPRPLVMKGDDAWTPEAIGAFALS